VPEAHLAVLQVLWEQGEATRRQIAEVLYPAGTPANYSTVQKLLERLEERGLVRRGGTERQRAFAATLTRDEWLGRRLGHLADRLCGGALTPLVLNLVKVRPLTAGELDELRAFVREQERKGREP
jgi:BlaI family penicillinase repressor